MHHPKNIKNTGFIQLELEIEEYPWPQTPIVEDDDSEEDVERGVYIIDLM